MNLPLMPKGVEHMEAHRLRTPTVTVNLPLMPKGVEHFCTGIAKIGLVQ